MPQTAGTARALPVTPDRQRAYATGAPLALAAVLGSCVLASPASAEPERVKVPAPRVASAVESSASAPAAAPVTTRMLGAPVRSSAGPTYTVRAGDTVSHIAARTGLSQASIIAANGLDRRALIRVGQVLTLPGAGGSAPAVAASGGGTYTVRAGDTVSHVAARTGVSQASIIAANNLGQRALIRVGQVLTLPGATGASTTGASTAPATSSGTYTVRAGDTVSHVAARTGVSQASIIAANNLGQRALIRVGQVLTLPGATTTGTTSTTATTGAPASGSYTVQAGDTLSHIAVRASTTIAALRAANPGLDARGTIRVGQVITVPGGSTGTSSSAPMPNTFAGRTYPASTVAAATVNRDVLAARSVPSRDQMRQIIADAARSYGVDPALALAIGFQESGFNQRAVSPANAVGAMQVIPSSGTWASDMAGRRLDLLDPHDNAVAGVLVLRANLRSSGDEAIGIAAYYQGLASVRKNGMFADTRRYVANVQTLKAQFR